MPPAEPVRLVAPGTPVTAWDFPGPPDGPVIVGIADFTANGLWFGDLAAACAEDARVVAPDLRGRAASSAAPPPTDLGDHVSDVLAVAAAVDTPTFIVVGHGTGAILALELAATAPDRVRALVLLDGPPCIDSDGRSHWTTAAARFDPGIERLGRTYPHRDSLVASGQESGRIPATGMSRALRRAVDAEVVGSGFGWTTRLDARTLERDWSRFAEWIPPSIGATPVTTLRARHGHRHDDPPIVVADDCVEATVIDTSHTGLLTHPEVARVVCRTKG